MTQKRWAKISAFVGIVGGPLTLCFILTLIAAGIGASRSGALISLALLVATFAIIFFVALKSARYYKKDERVNQVIANLFVASSGVGFVISLLMVQQMFRSSADSVIGLWTRYSTEMMAFNVRSC